MCKYCEETKERAEIDNNGEIKIKINEQMGNNLEINYYHFGTKVGRYIPIAFCPMCGRLVNKEVLEDIKKSIGDPKHGGTVGVNAAMPVFNEIGIDIQGEINKIIEKSMFDRRKFYARRYVVNGRARLY